MLSGMPRTLLSPAITDQMEAAQKFLAFVNQSPSPFHAVKQAALRLENAGFRKVREVDDWDKNLKAGKYYFTRNQTSLVAFTVPPSWRPGGGFSVVATHVDSPNLRIRPISKKSKEGFLQVGVETYGGGIWHTWFDRDLSVAGRVIVSQPNGRGVAQAFESVLVKIDRPVLRIPTLAIHLDRTVNDAFKFNTETELLPILGMVNDELNAQTGELSEHHSHLLSLLKQEANLEGVAIHDLELHLYDTQPSVTGGTNNEFIFSPRLDNLLSSFCAVQSLADSGLGTSDNVNVAILFNHEEVGSVSSTGAESSLLPSLIARLSPTSSSYAQSIARSFVISADMTHGVHPNYGNKHQDEHRPKLNGGVAIKLNAKQRYASDTLGAFLVKRLAALKGTSCQEFQVRNDSPCGSTVGPFLSKLGLRTVDVGVPQLSMHSIREMCGTGDVQACLDLFAAFYESFSTVDAQLNVE